MYLHNQELEQTRVYKAKSIHEKRQKALYDEVKQSVRKGEKRESGIISFSKAHYLSTRTCWRDLSAAVKRYGKIIY